MSKKGNNFIEKYYLPNLSICDDLITLFKKSKNKSAGQVETGVKKEIKDSTDLILRDTDISQSKILIKYFEELSKILDLYKNKYQSCDTQVPIWGLEPTFRIQKYKRWGNRMVLSKVKSKTKKRINCYLA